MFTGIVLCTGRLKALSKKNFPELSVMMELPREIRIGDSVAVNGACLTVTGIHSGEYRFDLSRETLALSNFGDIHPGDPLNIELPLTLNDLLGGHLVSGHLDGTVRTQAINKSAERSRFVFTYTRTEWRPFLIHKGSVTLNGISLTLAETGSSHFAVEVIPHTLDNTNLKVLKIGQRVNLELDLIGKYVYNLTLQKRPK
jgi:riboflavin synthase